MGEDANVGSLDAIREFRAVIATFMHESHDAITTFDLEARRALEWLVDDAPKYWDKERRKCEDRIVEAKIAFQTCKAQKLPGGGEPACLEEKKDLDRAKAQLVYIQDKIQRTKKWGAVASRQALEYKGRSNQLQSVLDSQLPNALALLDRVLNSLEAYISLKHENMAKRYDKVMPPSAAQQGDETQPEKPAAEQAKAAAGEGTVSTDAANGAPSSGSPAEQPAPPSDENRGAPAEAALSEAAASPADR